MRPSSFSRFKTWDGKTTVASSSPRKRMETKDMAASLGRFRMHARPSNVQDKTGVRQSLCSSSSTSLRLVAMLTTFPGTIATWRVRGYVRMVVQGLTVKDHTGTPRTRYLHFALPVVYCNLNEPPRQRKIPERRCRAKTVVNYE